MKYLKIGIIILAFSMTGVLKLQAQENDNVTASDFMTYRQYLSQNWDSLIITGNKYLKKGTDYYYLRMRMAVAYYEKHNYVKAIKHFEKARLFNPSDPVTTEYLYFANLFRGNGFEAELWSKRLSPERRKELGIKNHLIDGISADLTYSNTARNDIPAVDGATGSQQIPENFLNANITLKHVFLKRFQIVHGFTYLLKNNQYYTPNLTTIPDYSDKITQTQYYTSGTVYPANGLLLSVSWQNLWIRIPQYSGNQGQGNGNKKNYSSKSEFSYSFSLMKSFGYFDAGYTYTGSELNNYNQKQHSILFNIYPLGNFNLYLLSRVTFFSENPFPERNSVINGEILGFKLAKHLWAEVNLLAGNIKNFSDFGSYIIYNDVNPITFRSGLSLLFPMNTGITFSLRGNQTNSESSLYGLGTNQNTIKYSSISLTGGLSWNL